MKSSIEDNVTHLLLILQSQTQSLTVPLLEPADTVANNKWS